MTQTQVEEAAPCRRTPLYLSHKERQARFVAFGGWEMPVWYSSIIAEHNAVRNACGLFDVSHMGEVFISGPQALALLQHVTCNDVSKLNVGDAHYSVLMLPNGAAVDDIIVYRIEPERYLVCVNASNVEKDYQYFLKQNSFGAKVENRSEEFCQLALQGPKAFTVLKKMFPSISEDRFPSFTVLKEKIAGGEAWIARTGYSGEDGVEIFFPAVGGRELWDRFLEIGAPEGIQPIGLGARDSLRLEACYPLYGHELNEEVNIISAGLSWVVKFDKGDFIGRDALLKAKTEGTPKVLVGLEVEERGIVREGSKLHATDGAIIGWVTSGSKIPNRAKALALAYIDPKFRSLGTAIDADVRDHKVRMHVVKKPFYKREKVTS